MVILTIGVLVKSIIKLITIKSAIRCKSKVITKNNNVHFVYRCQENCNHSKKGYSYFQDKSHNYYTKCDDYYCFNDEEFYLL
jgi:hypothetical protein